MNLWDLVGLADRIDEMTVEIDKLVGTSIALTDLISLLGRFLTNDVSDVELVQLVQMASYFGRNSLGCGLGKGGKVTLYVDGKKVGEGAIPMTQATIFSADDGCDVGEDSGAPVSPDYGSRGNGFNGRIKGVQLAIADAAENSDHLVSPEDAIRIAMARQ